MIKRLWKSIFNAVERAPVSGEERLRIVYFLVFVVFGVFTMIGYGIHHLYAGHYRFSALIAVCATGLVVGWMVLLRLRNGKIVYRLNGLLFCMLLLYMVMIGGAEGSKALWSFTFPLIAFFLLGLVEGCVWSVALLMAVLFLMIDPFATPGRYRYGGEFIVRFASSYVLIAAVTYWYEHFRTRYRRQLRTADQRFSDILEHSRDILYRRDLATGSYVYISRAFGDFLGYGRDDIDVPDLSGIEDLIHPDDRQVHAALLEQIIGDRRLQANDHTVEYRMRCKDGTYLWFSDRVAVIRDGAGHPTAIIGSNREITRQRRMKLAVQKARDQLLTILDSIDAHIYVADMETYRVLFMNSKMRRDFGRDMQGEICWQVFRHGDRPCEHCTNHLLLDEDGRPTGVHEWESYNPVVGRWYNNYDRAIQWIDGRWVRIQIAVDISRIKEMEAEQRRNAENLRRAERFEAIGTLAGGIAHDFNNLLQVILGQLSLLELDCRDDDEIMAGLETIKEAAHKSRKLANRLITFTAGGAPNAVAVPPTHILKAAVATILEGTGVASEMDLDADLWPAPIDVEQMRLVFESVISNAVESMDGVGQLSVRARNLAFPSDDDVPDVHLPAGDYVAVHIGDNGRGIPDDVLPRIFDPYFSTKRRGADKGMGLSLSVAYSIVRQHRGDIRIMSRVGHGTHVDIYLPAHTEV